MMNKLEFLSGLYGKGSYQTDLKGKFYLFGELIVERLEDEYGREYFITHDIYKINSNSRYMLYSKQYSNDGYGLEAVGLKKINEYIERNKLKRI